jgi:hypothetical protein
MVANPYETVSDSFYFVGDELVMHNKAFYAYHVDETSTTSRTCPAASLVGALCQSFTCSECVRTQVGVELAIRRPMRPRCRRPRPRPVAL